MEQTVQERFSFYPQACEVDAWVARLWSITEQFTVSGKILEQSGVKPEFGNGHTTNYSRYVEFSVQGKRTFYGYWQPAAATPAPLIIHVPGYGAEMSIHPELVSQGYNVLHICPQGYVTPKGPDTSLQADDIWPVLPNTVLGKHDADYTAWLLDCMAAIQWATAQAEVIPQRLSFLGTSQGGGGALLLASIYKEKGARCVCADVPFLTNFPKADFRGAYSVAKKAFDQTDEKAAWNRVGYIDTLSHAHRLTVPALLTAGEKDQTCPLDTIESLFEKLTCTKSYTKVKGMGHGYSREILYLATAWFRLYG